MEDEEVDRNFKAQMEMELALTHLQNFTPTFYL